jgi:hypothetical protein
VDPDSLNLDSDPDTDPDPDLIRIQGFDDQKLKEKKTAENFFNIFFRLKIAIYLCPSHQPSKENIQHLKNCNL